MYLLNSFFVYSVLGFLLESLFSLVFNYKYQSGILIGPWTPIYGLGVIIILVASEKIFKNMHKKRIIETLTLFLVITVILSFIEWLGGTLIELAFDQTFWDYSTQKFNIGKYISLEMAIVWGVGSIIFIYLIRPILDNYILKIPKWMTLILIILFFIDIVITLIIKIT